MKIVISCLIAFIILCIAGVLTLKKLEKRKLIPRIENPYTGGRDYTILFDLIRLYVFLGMMLLSIWLGNGKMAIGFGVITLFQVVWLLLQIKGHKTTKTRTEIIFSAVEREEWKEYFVKNQEKFKFAKVKDVGKIVVVNDTIYFSKKNTIVLKERVNKYTYLHSIEIDNQVMTFKYGPKGSPLFRRCIFIPKEKEGEILNMMELIQKNKVN